MDQLITDFVEALDVVAPIIVVITQTVWMQIDIFAHNNLLVAQTWSQETIQRHAVGQNADIVILFTAVK